ncbi:amino acid permease [Gimibacter soli]|uniref:Amino acid permease n=1 Tax=Gimibacter soli TaxID=3024400 RepID=A0AAE9XNG6_9PROT|nr:amino acid permease [Gimibacter soli]WCL53272.1 amino acid permease [Gimibacter soli]
MSRPFRSLFIRKSIESVRQDVETSGLDRSLGATHLVLLGIGIIIGAGVYVMTGTAAANYAGPAVVLSFAIAGFACCLTGLCYAELASVLPVSGASYSYCYTVLGEVVAWSLAWMLMLEFGLAGSALAVGFSGYLISFLADFGIYLPAALATSTIEATRAGSEMVFTAGPQFNLMAVLSLAVVCAVLIRGVAHSATVNMVLVIVKVGILFLFVATGFSHVDAANWTPFIPENQGGFAFGWPGVVRAASILFFAYLGFEAVATAAAESRKPQRDIPIGILGALLFSTLIYVAVAMTLTGLVSYTELSVPDPIAVAVNHIGMPAIGSFIKVGALTGLASVLLVNTYGQSRIGFAMSRDGLLPPLFSRVHPRFQTPAAGTIAFAAISAVAAGLLPITLLADFVSIGAACMFIVVALSVMFLRTHQPDLPRPFKVPFGGIRVRGVWLGVIPVLALVMSLLMMGPVLVDIAMKAIDGEWLPAIILGGYIALGAGLYFGYGRHNSRIWAEAQSEGK